MNITRRDMMKMTSAGIAAASLPLGSFATPDTIKISLQLYSIRNHCKENFDTSLDQVAAMGFDGVEFAGYYHYDSNPEALKKKLDKLSLKAAGTHINAHSFEAKSIQKTIDFHSAIGCKYLIVPGDKRFSDPEQSKLYAELMNKASELLKPHGMYCGHHNHTTEFKKDLDTGRTYWDLFAERTNKDVVLQQDVGWTTQAGLDAAALIKKYPGRTKITHFKPTALDKNMDPIIGKDSVPWKEIITACREAGGTEWFTIEQEKYLPGKTPMECSELSFKGLKSILAEMA